MKTGDKVRLTRTELPYFVAGSEGKLLYQDRGGDWWADFSMSDNRCGDGIWCIGTEGFELVNEEVTP